MLDLSAPTGSKLSVLFSVSESNLIVIVAALVKISGADSRLANLSPARMLESKHLFLLSPRDLKFSLQSLRSL